jgi:hypothetical protein
LETYFESTSVWRFLNFNTFLELNFCVAALSVDRSLILSFNTFVVVIVGGRFASFENGWLIEH